MEDLAVYRIISDRLARVGLIRRSDEGASFSYDESYLASSHASPLSLSLPITDAPYEEAELRPYFEGLLPEGPTREALAAQLDANANDYLTLLGSNGLDCIGDVVIRPSSEDDRWPTGSYMPIETDDLWDTLSALSHQARSNAEARLSLAGTQGKVGLAHHPASPIAEGWLHPAGGAASTHILKTSKLPHIAEFELLCMRGAESCGINAAHTEAFTLGTPIICSERYDRHVSVSDATLTVTRLHQEDFAQAFGISPAAKYRELEGGTYHAIAQLLYESSSFVLEDINQLARTAVFDYLVGNCDNHLKNLSLSYEDGRVRLAPAYDLVCTTFFERFSRTMGMRIGSTRSIDEVLPRDFGLLAREIGMGARRMRQICDELSCTLVPAIADVGERYSQVLPELPYTAEDLIDDLGPRLKVVSEAAGLL